MKTSAISSLKKSLPHVFAKHQLQDLPEGMIIRPGSISTSDRSSVENVILSDLEEATENSIRPDRQPERGVYEVEIDDASLKDVYEDQGTHDREGRLKEPFRDLGHGGIFAGAPSDIQKGLVAPPDALAFYLPYHRFSAQIYGIYLFADGVRHLTRVFFRAALGALSAPEAMALSKAFLFHHEAYHNAIEVFATRIELAHRDSVYESGARACVRGYPSPTNEEALATGYAIMHASKAIPKKGVVCTALLRAYTRLMPSPYNIGASLVDEKLRKSEERNLQEAICQKSFPNIPIILPDAWAAGPHLTHPSLSRGKSFSYILTKNSSLGRRIPLDAIYFADRRRLVRKLKDYLGGGSEISGGRHPMFQAPNGYRVPIPFGKDIDEGTLGNILKSFEIPIRPREFMRLQRYK